MENMVSPLGSKKRGEANLSLISEGNKTGVCWASQLCGGKAQQAAPCGSALSRWAGRESTRAAFNTYKRTALARTEFNHCLAQSGLPREQRVALHTPWHRDRAGAAPLTSRVPQLRSPGCRMCSPLTGLPAGSAT